MKIEISRGSEIIHQNSKNDVNLVFKKEDITKENYIDFCRLKLKDFVIGSVGQASVEYVKIANTIIDNIPDRMFNDLKGGDFESTLMVKHIIYALLSNGIVCDQTKLFQIVSSMYFFKPQSTDK